MNPFAHGSIVFRLWIALSVIATVFTTIALALYVWLAVNDNLERARLETHGKVQAVLATASRNEVFSGTPSESQISSAHGLGIVRIDLLNEDGAVVQTLNFSPRASLAPPMPEEGALVTARRSSMTQTL